MVSGEKKSVIIRIGKYCERSLVLILRATNRDRHKLGFIRS